MIPRPYQVAALEALHAHVCTKDTNPCVVLPTGSGKSLVMGWSVKKWKEDHPPFRAIILAHRRELIEQNVAELKRMYPEGDIGVFSAGLGKRDYDASLLFGSIDSVYRRAGDFAPWNAIIVDEAHRIPFRGEGKYRKFINESKRFSPDLRVIGWTATPWRMAGGRICHPDHILNEVCYEAKLLDLIAGGYLCSLRTKVGSTQPTLDGVKKSGGDYVISNLAKVTNRNDVVRAAIAEAVQIINAESRAGVIFFCVNIEHCILVSQTLAEYGLYAPVVTSRTPEWERVEVARQFKARQIRSICNVNVYTEGFNATHVDCIVLLRPTLSAGLYSQMVGRGLRVDSDKKDCLVLDFAHCIDEHGPVDLLGGNSTRTIVCSICKEAFSRAIGACPACGWVIPKKEIERLESIETKRRLHDAHVSTRSILSGEPEICKVDQVYVNRHCKPGSPDSVRVQYRCGLRTFVEWVCLDHKGYSGERAQQWWRERFCNHQSVTVNEALGNLLTVQVVQDYTKTITVKKEGKYYKIINYNQSLPEKLVDA